MLAESSVEGRIVITGRDIFGKIMEGGIMFYLAFDFDKIHDYVFAPRKLKEIVGGSSLLDEFNILDL